MAITSAPSIPDRGGLKYPNLGSRLDGLVASVETGQTTAKEAATDSPVHSGESVAVTIYLSGSVDGVVSFLENNGAPPPPPATWARTTSKPTCQ